MTKETVLASALADAGVVTHTRHAYFDLTEFLDTKLDHEQFKSNVTNSMAWFVDVMAINAARSLFFDRYQESEKGGTAEDYNAFIDGFLGTLSEAEAGSEFTDQLGQDLVQLIGFSPKMHDIASAASSAAGRDYNPKTYDQLLSDEKPMPVTALTQAKLAQMAKFVVEGEEGDIGKAEAETLAMLLESTKNRAADAHDNRKRINPIVLGLIAVGERHAPEIEFHQLDRKLQLRMVLQANKSLKTVAMRLATYNSISPLEYAMILRNMRDTMRELDKVAETYRDPEEAAAIPAMQRAAKARAAKSESATFEADEAATAEADATAKATRQRAAREARGLNDDGSKADAASPTNTAS